MAYDYNWARRVVAEYTKLTPRVQQIVYCCDQLIAETIGPTKHLSYRDAIKCLENWVKHQGKGVLWRRFKKLVKKTPLDQTLLLQVANDFSQELYDIRIEALQSQFDF